MTPDQMFLAIIAAEMGFAVLFLVIFMCLEICNGMYIRRCYAEAQLKEAERQANNPFAGMTLQVPGGQQQLAGAVAAAQATGETPAAPCAEEKCEDGCDACKAKHGGGQYL